MAKKRNAFVLPLGLDLDTSSETLDITFDGDVVLEQTFGKPIGTLDVTGDLVLQLTEATGNIKAGGKLSIGGSVNAERIEGRDVYIGDVNVRCQAITATRRIVIGAATLRVDAIIAPSITVAPKATGRVTVIESHNEPGPSKIKGGFSLREYDELLGDAQEFLARRGLVSLDDMPEVEEDEEEDGDDPPTDHDADLVQFDTPVRQAVAAVEIDDLVEIEELEELDIIDEPSPHRPAPPPPPAPPKPPAPPLPEVGEDGAIQPRLQEVLKRITSCYSQGELPPSIEQLSELIEARDYPGIRTNINQIWNGLLGHHQRRGIRPHHQVTRAFNIIHEVLP